MTTGAKEAPDFYRKDYSAMTFTILSRISSDNQRSCSINIKKYESAYYIEVAERISKDSDLWNVIHRSLGYPDRRIALTRYHQYCRKFL